MFASENLNRFAVRYIICLVFASLLFALLGAQAVSAQGVDMGGVRDGDVRDPGSSALSEGLGGVRSEVEGFRSSIDDGARRVRRNVLIEDDAQDRVADDSGFENVLGDMRRPGQASILDGNLRAQYQAATRQRVRAQDGDLEALVTDDGSGVDEFGERVDDRVDDRVVREQAEFLDAVRGAEGTRRAFVGGDETAEFIVDPRFGPVGPISRGGPVPQSIDEDVQGERVTGRARNRETSPYAPVGLEIGRFRVFPEVIVSGAYGDNVRQSSTSRDSDVSLELRPSIRAQSNWRRHSLEGDVNAFGSYHNEFDTEDDREFSSNLRGRIDVTRRTNIEGEAGYALAQQSRGSADAPGGAIESPDVETLRGALALNHRFNRLSIRLRGEVSETQHDDAQLIGGGLSDESDQDNLERRFVLRGSYELNSAISIFSEGLVERRDFDSVANSDGLSRDSDAFGLRAGILFDNGSKLYGEASVGLVRLTPDDRRLNDFDGVTFDGEITWRPTQLTTLTAQVSTSINATTVAGAAGALTHSANLRVQHELLRHFILSAGIGLDHVDYKGTSLVERSYSGELGAEYIFNRNAALIAVYQYDFFDTNSVNSAYTSNQIRLGMRFRR